MNITNNRRNISRDYPSKIGGKKSGYVYAGYHSSFPGMVKIGSTKNLQTRASNFNTCYPDNNFRFTSFHWSPNRRKAELDAQSIAEENHTRSGEWFRISCKSADKVIKKAINNKKSRRRS
tara:strand:- start:14 stop:373 length:360 start_codon:yes stop_codon:yes gene_type:complete